MPCLSPEIIKHGRLKWKAQTFSVNRSSSASTSLHVALSSAALAFQPRPSHQDRFKTLTADVNDSTASAASLKDGMVFPGEHVGTALQSSRCAPLFTDWDVGEESAACLAVNTPSLNPPLHPSLFLSASVLLIHFTFSQPLFSSESFPLHRMS